MSNTELFPETKDSGLIRGFTARELRAINSAIKRYGYVPRLSIYPNVDFVSKDTGSEVRVHVDELLHIYDEDRKEAAKERARAKRMEQSRGRRY